MSDAGRCVAAIDPEPPPCGWCGEGCTHGPACACGPCRERARTEARARVQARLREAGPPPSAILAGDPQATLGERGR